MEPSPPLSIIRATQKEIGYAREACEQLHRRSPIDERSLLPFLTDPDCYLLLAFEGDQLVGSLNGYALRQPNRPKPQFLLYEIDVREDSRNRGIGRALVAAFIEEARAAGAFEVWVLTNASNAPAIKMYIGCGMQRENTDDLMLAINLEHG